MNENSQFLLYTAPDGAVKVDVFFKEETVWLTQKALAELCLLYTSPSPRDRTRARMPSSA